MKRLTHHALFWAMMLVVFGCNNDELDDLNQKLKEVNSAIENLDAKVSELEFALSVVEAKNNFYEKQQQNRLLISYQAANDTTYFLFEDEVAVAVTNGMVQGIALDSVAWKAEVSYTDNTSQSINFLGNEQGILVERTELNPGGFSPLMASTEITTPVSGKMTVTVKGRYGTETDITKTFDGVKTNHVLEVFGLYADTLNTVEITFSDAHGHERITKEIEVRTYELPASFPQIDVTVRQTEKMEEGLTLISYLAARDPSIPFAIDSHGDVRWYLDYSSHADFATLAFDNGVERLRNGNLYFGDKGTHEIVEAALNGKIINRWSLHGYQFHHNVEEKPNGNFLVTVDKPGSLHLNGKPTVEDYIIEINRSTGALENVWDLKESLDEYRITMANTLSRASVDWIHVNAITFDPSDNTIIVSGRTQGVIKLTEDNHVKWILNMHDGWTAGRNGIDLNQFLLTPLDGQNQPITDEDVLKGVSNHPDFEWTWYQHAPEITPNGTLLIFDNGDRRNYTGEESYSRAVEYEIDETNMTVKQVWAYGKERGTAGYSRIVSDVDFLPGKGNVLFAPGFQVQNSGGTGAKVIEIDYESSEVVFEVEITQPTGVTLHRAERLVF